MYVGKEYKDWQDKAKAMDCAVIQKREPRIGNKTGNGFSTRWTTVILRGELHEI